MKWIIQKKIIFAAEHGNLTGVNTFLQEPVCDVNAAHEDSCTALIHAAKAGYTDCVLAC